MSTQDTRTDAERRYDAERDGTLYVKAADEDAEDTPLSDVEREVIGALFPSLAATSPASIKAAADAAAWESVCETIADPDFEEVEDLELSAEEETIIDLILARTPAEAATDSFKRGLITGYRAGREVQQVMADTKEHEPVPPVPPGYPTDRALLYREYHGVFLAVDRRDGETVVSTEDTDGEYLILKPAQAIALFQWFQEESIKSVMRHAWSRYMQEHGSAKLAALVREIDAHFAAAPMAA